jgi:DNA-binding CsgD family transcriptional regulator
MTSGLPDVVRRWIDAYNAQDLAAIIDLAHPDVLVTPPRTTVTVPSGTSYRGHEGIRSLFAPGFERYPRSRVEPGPPSVLGQSTVVPVTMILDDGEAPPVRTTGALLFVVDDDRVRVIRTFETVRDAHAAAERGYGVLTQREREVLSLLAEGMTAKQIADRLVVSALTVRTHVRNAKAKLGARTTAHAIAMAQQDHETGS